MPSNNNHEDCEEGNNNGQIKGQTGRSVLIQAFEGFFNAHGAQRPSLFFNFKLDVALAE